MGKYPDIDRGEIAECISLIRSEEFDTKEFIRIWKREFPVPSAHFSGIGPGWMSMVGKNLSWYAVRTGEIVATGRKRRFAEIWRIIFRRRKNH